MSTDPAKFMEPMSVIAMTLECYVCKVQKPLITLPCSHSMCIDCANQWYEENRKTTKESRFLICPHKCETQIMWSGSSSRKTYTENFASKQLLNYYFENNLCTETFLPENIYCSDCFENICAICYCNKHAAHSCQRSFTAPAWEATESSMDVQFYENGSRDQEGSVNSEISDYDNDNGIFKEDAVVNDRILTTGKTLQGSETTTIYFDRSNIVEASDALVINSGESDSVSELGSVTSQSSISIEVASGSIVAFWYVSDRDDQPYIALGTSVKYGSYQSTGTDSISVMWLQPECSVFGIDKTLQGKFLLRSNSTLHISTTQILTDELNISTSDWTLDSKSIEEIKKLIHSKDSSHPIILFESLPVLETYNKRLFMEKETKMDGKEIVEDYCGICGGYDVNNGMSMVTCGICSVNIHIRCASLPQKILREKSYSCPRCKYTSEANRYAPQCSLCPISENKLFLECDLDHFASVVKRTPPHNRDWCHMFCKYSDNLSLDGVGHAKCSFCGQDKGVVKCYEEGCTSKFHISCAWLAGLKLQRSDFTKLLKDQELKIWGFCWKHSPKILPRSNCYEDNFCQLQINGLSTPLCEIPILKDASNSIMQPSVFERQKLGGSSSSRSESSCSLDSSSSEMVIPDIARSTDASVIAAIAQPSVLSSVTGDIAGDETLQHKNFDSIAPNTCDICQGKLNDRILVTCQTCKVTVHKICYGIAKVVGDDWKCDACENGNNPEFLKCRFCTVQGGAYKRALDGHWLHVLCFLPMNELSYSDSRLDAVKLSNLNVERFKLKCRNPTCDVEGAKVKCDFQGCNEAIHPQCLLKSGMVLHFEDYGNHFRHIFSCPLHETDVKNFIIEGKRELNITEVQNLSPLPILNTIATSRHVEIDPDPESPKEIHIAFINRVKFAFASEPYQLKKFVDTLRAVRVNDFESTVIKLKEILVGKPELILELQSVLKAGGILSENASIFQVSPKISEKLEDSDSIDHNSSDIVSPDNDKISSESEICDVCCEEVEGETLIFCDGCDVAVHQYCYGVQEIPSESEKWFCNVCVLNRHPKTVRCWLCSLSGGAFKPTTKSKWVHVYCTRFFPEVFVLGESESLEPFNVDEIDMERFRLPCCNRYCRIKTNKGACIQCASSGCYKAVHPKCISAAKMREVWDDDENKPMVYCENCISTDDSDDDDGNRSLQFSRSHGKLQDPSSVDYQLVKSPLEHSANLQYIRLVTNSLHKFVFSGNSISSWKEITAKMYYKTLIEALSLYLDNSDGYVLVSVKSFGSEGRQKSCKEILAKKIAITTQISATTNPSSTRLHGFFYHKISPFSKLINGLLKVKYERQTAHSYFLLILATESDVVIRSILKSRPQLSASSEDVESEKHISGILEKSSNDVGIFELLKSFFGDFKKNKEPISGQVEFITDFSKSSVPGYHCIFDKYLGLGVRAMYALRSGSASDKPMLRFPLWLNTEQKRRISNIALKCDCLFSDCSSNDPLEISFSAVSEGNISKKRKISSLACSSNPTAPDVASNFRLVPSVIESDKKFYVDIAHKHGGEVQVRPDGYNFLVFNAVGEVIFDTESADQRMLGAFNFEYNNEIEIGSINDLSKFHERERERERDGVVYVPTEDGSHWVIKAGDEIFDLFELEKKYKIEFEDQEDDIDI